MTREADSGDALQGGDEIIFTGEYKDFRLGVKFDVDGKQPQEVASALCYISGKIEPHAFRFSGIDMKNIEAFAKCGKGISGVIGFLEANPPGALKAELGKGLAKPELLSAAESYLFNRLLTVSGVAFKPSVLGNTAPAEEEIGDFIGFIGKYGSWIAIKKLGLEKVADYEVSGILSGINHTIVNKSFEFAGQKDGSEALLKGKRRSYGNLADSLKELERLGGIDAMTVCKVFERVGYKPYASPEMLTDAYPDIKPPKVKGRKPKG